MAIKINGVTVIDDSRVGNLAAANVTGNVVGGNLSGSLVTGTLTTAAQPNVTSVGTLSSLAVTGNVSTGNVSGTLLTGTLTTAAQPNVTSVGTLSSLSVTGNVSTGNVSGTLLTGTLATAAQPNVTSVGTLTSLTVTGNVSTGNVSGTLLTGTLATAAQPNVTSVGTLTSLTVTGNVTGGNLTTVGRVDATGNITGGNVSGTLITGTLTTAAQPNVTSVGTLTSLTVTGNVSGGNLTTSGAVTGNGRALTSLNASNIDTGTLAQTRLANSSFTLNGNVISLGGTETITAQTPGSLTFNDSGSGGSPGCVWSGGSYTTISYNSVGAPGVAGNNATGTWSISVTGSAGTAGTVTTNAQPNITSLGTLSSLTATGNITGGNLVTSGNIQAGNLIISGIEAVTTLNVSGDTTIVGNLTVSGTTITANVQSLVVTDPILGLGRGANGNPLTSNDGLDRGIEMFYYNTAERIAFMGFDNNEGKMLSASNVSIANNIVTVNSYGTTVVGTLEAASASVTGNVAGGNLTTAGAVVVSGTGAATNTTTGSIRTGGGIGVAGNAYVGGLLSVTGNANVGNIGATNIVGTLTTAAQTNITSLGTLTSLTVTGNITGGNLNTGAQVVATGNITGGNLSTGGMLTSTKTGGTADGNGQIYLNGATLNRIDYNANGAAVPTLNTRSAGTKMVLFPGVNASNVDTAIGVSGTGNLWLSVPNTASTITFYNATQNALEYSNGNLAITALLTAATANLTTNTVSTSTTTGTLKVAGGVGVVGNIYVGGQVVATGNVQGNFFIGNGSQLTGIATGTPTKIESGTSEANIRSSGGNLTITIGGTANVGTFTTTGANISGTLNATGNANVGNLGTAGLITATGNVSGGNLTTAGRVDATGNITGGNLNTGAQVVATGNVSGGNLTTGAQVVATGNVTGGNLNTAGMFTSTKTGGTADGNAQIYLNGATLNRMDFNTNGVAAPAFTTRSAGAKIVLYPNIGASAADYALGVETGNMWFGVPTTTEQFRWYAGTTLGLTLANGVLTAVGNVSGSNLVTAGRVVATGNVEGGNLIVTNNIVDTGALEVITSSNGNITFSPNGTGVVVFNKDLRNGQANGVGNIGTTGGFFNTVFAKATSAQYADLAEMYEADADYESGTVVAFGGVKEITVSLQENDSRVAGVISTNPAHLMNSALDGECVLPVALTGRVPTRVTGAVNKGDMMVSAGDGTARACAAPQIGTVIGKALEDFSGDSGVIEVVVGRL